MIVDDDHAANCTVSLPGGRVRHHTVQPGRIFGYVVFGCEIDLLTASDKPIQRVQVIQGQLRWVCCDGNKIALRRGMLQLRPNI